MGGLQALPGETGRGQKPPEMLEIMGIGDHGVGGIIACGEVAEKGRDLWHGCTGVVEELNLQGPVIARDASNQHCPSSLSTGESIPA